MKRDELEQCLRGWKVRLRDSAHDVEEIQRRFYASKGAAAVRSLEKNGFAAHYAASRGEAAALLLSLIPDGAVVGVGDSHTIYALDLDEKLAAKGCQAIPSMAALTGTSYDCNPPGHYRAPTREEALMKMKWALAEFIVEGVDTNIDFQLNLIKDADVEAGRYDIGFLTRRKDLFPKE